MCTGAGVFVGAGVGADVGVDVGRPVDGRPEPEPEYCHIFSSLDSHKPGSHPSITSSPWKTQPCASLVASAFGLNSWPLFT